MNVPVNQPSIKLLTKSSLFVYDLWGAYKLTVNSLLIHCNTCYNATRDDGTCSTRDTPVGSGMATHPGRGGARTNSCPQHWNRKKKKNPPPTPPPPCCFPVEWNNLPPSGNPVWVRGPAFSLLLIVCSEEEVKHTIRHRWLSLPANVLIPSWGRSVPFLCDKCALIWS